MSRKYIAKILFFGGMSVCLTACNFSPRDGEWKVMIAYDSYDAEEGVLTSIPECPFDYLPDCDNINQIDESGTFTFLGFNCTLIESDFECESITNLVSGVSNQPSNTVLEEVIFLQGTFSSNAHMTFEIPRTITCEGDNCADYEMEFPCEDTLIGEASYAPNSLVNLGGMCVN